MHLGSWIPVCDIAIPPFRSDGHRLGSDAAKTQPVTKKGLREPIGPRCVEIPDTAVPGCVEHNVGMSTQPISASVSGQILAMADIEIRRPSQRGQPQPERGSRPRTDQRVN